MFITFLPLNKKIQVDTGVNLLQAARENGIHLEGVCSGVRHCGKCKALVTKGNTRVFEEEEFTLLTEEERIQGIRLACCFTVTQETCVVIQGNKPHDMDMNATKSVLSVRESITSDFADSRYGIAFDIGTTSVVGALWNLGTKEKMVECSKQNPQTLYGADVISRITYANSNKAHLATLTALIRSCCNDIIDELMNESYIGRQTILSVVIDANTTMAHLFLGRPVESLARVPFQGISYDSVECKAADFGLNIHPDAEVYIMPGIGGHVGSDTLGCILSTKLSKSTGALLMIDIGTNGEIVLAKNGELYACSTAAGPAFEGASLYQGMRAIDGAISNVEIVKEEIHIKYIGEEKPEVYPIGICGSGVIEAAAEFLENGIMDDSGRLLGDSGDKNQVILWQSVKGQVMLTQKDIRELQLAKGAIYTGMQVLLREAGVSLEELDKIYLAGAFGSNIHIKKAISIGLLPDIGQERIEYIGNGALDGATKLLLGDISRLEAEKISKSTQHLELAQCEDFSTEFMKAISFPKI